MKTGQVFELQFLLKLVLAIVLSSFIVLTAKNCVLGSSQQAIASFSDFAKTVSEIKEGELKSVPLIMDKDTAVLAFPASEDTIEIIKERFTCPDLAFARPELCEKDKACLCLCSDTEEHEDSKYCYHKKTCGKAICHSYEDSEFSSITRTDKEFGRVGENYYELRKGVAITRSFLKDDFVSDHERILAVYIAKEKGTIGLCLQSPCPT